MLKKLLNLFKREKKPIIITDLGKLLSLLRPAFASLCYEFRLSDLSIEDKVKSALKNYDEGTLRPEYYEGELGKHLRRYFKLWAESYFLSHEYGTKLYKIEEKLEKYMPIDLKDKI